MEWTDEISHKPSPLPFWRYDNGAIIIAADVVNVNLTNRSGGGEGIDIHILKIFCYHTGSACASLADPNPLIHPTSHCVNNIDVICYTAVLCCHKSSSCVVIPGNFDTG